MLHPASIKTAPIDGQNDGEQPPGAPGRTPDQHDLAACDQRPATAASRHPPSRLDGWRLIGDHRPRCADHGVSARSRPTGSAEKSALVGTGSWRPICDELDLEDFVAPYLAARCRDSCRQQSFPSQTRTQLALRRGSRPSYARRRSIVIDRYRPCYGALLRYLRRFMPRVSRGVHGARALV